MDRVPTYRAALTRHLYIWLAQVGTPQRPRWGSASCRWTQQNYRNWWHMKIIGTVASLWRYPVKSMRGEELDAAFMGFAGVYGDRLFAFRSAASPTGFPYLTGRSSTRCCASPALPLSREGGTASQSERSRAHRARPEPHIRGCGGPDGGCRDTLGRDTRHRSTPPCSAGSATGLARGML